MTTSGGRPDEASPPRSANGTPAFGGIFDATGTRSFVSIQHNISGKGVVLDITGWK